MNSNNTTSATTATTKLFNLLAWSQENGYIEIYNVVETYWSPEFEQFRDC